MSLQLPSVSAVQRRSIGPGAARGGGPGAARGGGPGAARGGGPGAARGGKLCSDSIHFRDAGANAATLAVGGNAKRAIDIVVSSMALLMLAPLLAAIWMALRLSIGGPVISGDDRVGLGGRTFQRFTFRCDLGVGSLGQFLRDTGLARLPQLWNVLIGDMSCVGPRPIAPETVEGFGGQHGVLIAARPGLTEL